MYRTVLQLSDHKTYSYADLHTRIVWSQNYFICRTAYYNCLITKLLHMQNCILQLSDHKTTSYAELHTTIVWSQNYFICRTAYYNCLITKLLHMQNCILQLSDLKTYSYAELHTTKLSDHKTTSHAELHTTAVWSQNLFIYRTAYYNCLITKLIHMQNCILQLSDLKTYSYAELHTTGVHLSDHRPSHAEHEATSIIAQNFLSCGAPFKR